MKPFWIVLQTFLVVLGWIVTLFITSGLLIDAGYFQQAVNSFLSVIGTLGTIGLIAFGITEAFEGLNK